MYKIIAENLFDGEKFSHNTTIIFDEKGVHHIGENINEKVKEEIRAKYVTPGFVDLASGIGLKEESLGRIEGDDTNEATNPQTPELLAVDGINPYDVYFQKILRGGVTKSLVLPGISNSIGGRGAFIFNYGQNILEMLIKSPVGMRFSVNTFPKMIYSGQKKMPMTRMGNAYLVREALFKAQEYKKSKKGFSMFEESLLPVLEGKDYAFFASFRADDIMTSVRISEEFKLNLVLTYAFEADLVKSELKKRNIPVAFGPTILPRETTELKHLSEKVPVELIEEGIELALISGHPFFPSEFLRLSAGLLIKHGIDREKALRTITSTPSKIIGNADAGSIKKGIAPDIVVFDGEPWETKSQVKEVFIKGKKAFESN